MEENEQQCQEWLYAKHENYVFWSGKVERWNIFGGDEHKIIDYCPFCGSPLDEIGCTKDSEGKQASGSNRHKIFKDLEVPF